MPLIALTGGIASGKSTIAQRLGEHGAIVVDADQIVRDLQAAGSPLLQKISDAFGESVISSDRSLNRAALGSLVFGNEDALRELNAIVHPAVLVESRRRFDQAFDADADAVVVYDVPLLAEARGADQWDLVVVADSPSALREKRLIELRGMEPDMARARIAAQVSDEERRSIADVVIDTSHALEHTHTQVDQLWPRLRDAPRR